MSMLCRRMSLKGESDANWFLGLFLNVALALVIVKVHVPLVESWEAVTTGIVKFSTSRTTLGSLSIVLLHPANQPPAATTSKPVRIFVDLRMGASANRS